MHENIVRLKISVHDIVFREYFEGLDHLSEINKCSFFRKRSFFLHESIQCTSVTEFINKIKVIYSFEHIDIFDNIRAGLNGGKNIDFVDCAFLKFWYLFELVCVYDFDGHLKFCFHMYSLVDFTVYSLSQLFLHRVVLDYLPHLSLLLSQ